MKIIELLGSKNKTDFAIYLAHTIASFEKRVLIVDATQGEFYRYGFTHLDENEYLYNLQNVEILIGAKDWRGVENLLNKENETSSNYDCILVDVDNVSTMIAEWPKFHEVLYVSDNDLLNIKKDVSLLHRWLDENENSHLRRIHFDSSYKLADGFIQVLMNNRIEFSPFSETIEYDDIENRLHLFMQYTQVIPYKKLNRTYKQILKELVEDWFEIDEKPKTFKTTLFNFSKKDKHHEKEVKEG